MFSVISIVGFERCAVVAMSFVTAERWPKGDENKDFMTPASVLSMSIYGFSVVLSTLNCPKIGLNA